MMQLAINHSSCDGRFRKCKKNNGGRKRLNVMIQGLIDFTDFMMFPSTANVIKILIMRGNKCQPHIFIYRGKITVGYDKSRR